MKFEKIDKEKRQLQNMDDFNVYIREKDRQRIFKLILEIALIGGIILGSMYIMVSIGGKSSVASKSMAEIILNKDY
jgi:hypothetical protein